jgi:hypothetical protein
LFRTPSRAAPDAADITSEGYGRSMAEMDWDPDLYLGAIKVEIPSFDEF